MTFFQIPRPETIRDVGAAPEVPRPDSSQCLECAFGKLLANGGVEIAEREQAAAVITDAEHVSTFNIHTRATIYRCNIPGCGRAMLAFTMIDQPLLPGDRDAIRIGSMPGSNDCLIPKEDLP